MVSWAQTDSLCVYCIPSFFDLCFGVQPSWAFTLPSNDSGADANGSVVQHCSAGRNSPGSVLKWLQAKPKAIGQVYRLCKFAGAHGNTYWHNIVYSPF